MTNSCACALFLLPHVHWAATANAIRCYPVATLECNLATPPTRVQNSPVQLGELPPSNPTDSAVRTAKLRLRRHLAACATASLDDLFAAHSDPLLRTLDECFPGRNALVHGKHMHLGHFDDCGRGPRMSWIHPSGTWTVLHPLRGMLRRLTRTQKL